MATEKPVHPFGQYSPAPSAPEDGNVYLPPGDSGESRTDFDPALADFAKDADRHSEATDSLAASQDSLSSPVRISSIPSNMEHQISKHEDVVILRLKGRLLGEHQTITLLEEMEEQIELGYVNFVVDLADLEFINSTGLNFLLTLLTKGRKQDGEVVLCNLNELLSKLIITTKLNSFFTIAENEEEALAHFTAETSE